MSQSNGTTLIEDAEEITKNDSQTNGIDSPKLHEKTNGVHSVSNENLNAIESPSSVSSTAVPLYGVKVKFNHKYPEKRLQNLRPSIRQSIPLIPCMFR